jgi:hypothetical protein
MKGGAKRATVRLTDWHTSAADAQPPKKKYMLHRSVNNVNLFTSAAEMTEDEAAQFQTGMLPCAYRHFARSARLTLRFSFSRRGQAPARTNQARIHQSRPASPDTRSGCSSTSTTAEAPSAGSVKTR